MNYSLFVSCAKGLEYLLEEELKYLGLQVNRVSPQGVFGTATLAVVYHLCVWSRLANRVQLILFSGEAHNEQALYQLCTQFPWQTVFTVDKTLAIEFHGSSAHIRNTMFGAQVVKDAIADHFRRQQGHRPGIDKENPQIRLHAHLKQDVVTVSFDLTGYSLHQRGYRTQAGGAPLRETIAAAMLIRAKWPHWAARGYSLLDPFCGSGTLVIEAAMMAAQIAPGLLRHDQSLLHWVQHQPSLWEKIRAQALQQVKPPKISIKGADQNKKMIALAHTNAEQAGVLPLVAFDNLAVGDNRPASGKGLVICNPPYGERMGEATQLIPLYQQLGHTLHAHFQGWEAAILTANPMLAKALGLRSDKQYTLYNGPLECKLYYLTLSEDNRLKGTTGGSLSQGAQMFANRLKKNQQHLQKWAKRQQISCYRVYDADLPEYAFAIDLYNDHAVLQEYSAPSSIPAHKAEKRSLEVIQVVPSVLGIAADNLVIKKRKQQKGKEQYQKLAQTKKTMVVTEGRAKFIVNLYDYLDTGLFLDHRPLRMRFSGLKPGSRFLNCFCYTATASVHAALGGALTTNVDMSKTYLKWAEDNFRLNHLDLDRHQFVHYDCLQWLKITPDKFDVIFMDPPSFSNSKRMTTTLDVQRDHEMLIQGAMGVLSSSGVLYFSTNRRQFRLADPLCQRYEVEDISKETLDPDFARNSRIHRCFVIRHKHS
ncbi:bifunctional 23S rRNA (guanine(2069)-N(7))-methyltransferase RlmK/23S rRNA (guanine(2445)-N(2))-methyltransferase RlmL [Legionella spiritensis]|uniref:Ribosomal RNA large subunit methyltransferase K/L n=1 Tax=Legionella spiritensis TaxID=452 RepID=A0A0W0YWL5_LEGSP|nr:bifunctional 23S rRNA (guanine(2069)-N(7))-methyltransferase RlmK/23S rRNA (guanine(2445)-N(2))-methyltransferase RlmL [Legionella spiritensis]KTD61257.1 Ribosomal RNA large subunit methyltransferase K/L [Legionella spiritensis]SNV23560.1 N6-adenine-specific DNA methylase [Legionella spiritensis]